MTIDETYGAEKLWLPPFPKRTKGAESVSNESK